jgi:acid phosphatase (class A)
MSALITVFSRDAKLFLVIQELIDLRNKVLIKYRIHYLKKGQTMKKTLLMAIATVMVAMSAHAQGDIDLDNEAMYFEIDDMPNAVVWLPAPPDTTSTKFVYDITQYMWGKTQRLDQDRAQQAIDNAVEDISDMLVQFSVPFGMELSKEKTPAIYHVLYRGVLTARLAATKPKTEYQRMRPYSRFNEHTLLPEGEERLRLNGSYPSGHTVRGWAMALLLCEINPAAQDSILTLGFEWGQSRVIAGYHWQSDVDASRLVASAAYARLHTNNEFLADMAAARAEYAALSEQNADITSIGENLQSPTNQQLAPIYNIDGTLATDDSRGILIQNHKKAIYK